MAEQLEKIGKRSLAEFTAGSLVVIHLENDRSFRTSLVHPEEGIATVWPVDLGQENTLEPGSLEAMSKLGSCVVEGEIRPRLFPFEAVEGQIEWGVLTPGQELVFQNESDAKGTTTCTGATIVDAYINILK